MALLTFIQQTINGITLGGIYALVALGYTMVYGVLKLINFAHSEVFMLGAMVGYFAAYLLGLAAPPSPVGLMVVAVLAMTFCGFTGVAIERIAYRPLRGSPRLAVLITAIGVGLFLQYLLQVNFYTYTDSATGQVVKVVGPEKKAMPQFLSDAEGRAFPPVVLVQGDDAGSAAVAMRPIDLVILPVTALMLIGLWLLTQRSQIGRAMRAVSYNADVAALMGINVDRTISFTFFIGSVLAGVAGVLVAVRDNALDPLMGLGYGLKAFVAAVLGGIGSLPGAVLGAVILGVVETYLVAFGSYIGIDGARWKDALAFTILIVVLVVKPSGLLGRTTREKV